MPKSAVTKCKDAFIHTGPGAQRGTDGPRADTSISRVCRRRMHSFRLSCTVVAQFCVVEELLRPREDSRIGEAYLSQLIWAAMQISLTKLLASWGVRPSMVLGRYSGEIVAAYAAGVLSMEGAMSAAHHGSQMAILLKERHREMRGAHGSYRVRVRKTSSVESSCWACMS